ncbi:hypothetical protein INR77_01720 [Erythrobacter sp. SCSIO 43205]|uniref:hypothetical protein n=1 Tax=Erythrobacter sp. SCSIO 43205 TaxID=2779361 RepID=UPI001CA8EA4D|nr:hypothetical protein [Erythrobacter sp. SCSIO 43205]UAB78482.1 hypothetical protein INR77_01720 [Erythrobacter sp. SCSIO 43205]
MTRTQLTSLGLIAASLALPTTASAQDALPALPEIQPMGSQDVRALPSDLRTAPALPQRASTSYYAAPDAVTTVGPDGVETITRTRRIERTAAPIAQTADYSGYGQGAVYGQGYGYGYGYPAGAQVFSREDWIDTCEDRTRGRRGKEKGGIIGGLLGAIAGGIIGNRAFDSERLGGTLLGAGVGGLGGVLLGSLIGGGRNDRGEYDCEAALDGYLTQYAHGGPQFAARSIPAPTYAPPVAAAPVYAAPQYGYTYAAPQYYYAPPQQIVYVPVEYQQRQRVVVRETVREEVIPGATRTIPAPAPRPIKTAPRPIKTAPRYIKGN